MTDLTWVDAIRRVLTDNGQPMNYADIADEILIRKYRKSGGATPAQTVAANLSMQLKLGNGEFYRASTGVYGLKVSRDQDSTPNQQVEDSESETGALRAFGMFWRRENVVWRQKGRLLGRQNVQAQPVDFAKQVGVYLLHDREKVIYVGRATDTVYTRLFAHVSDRLEGRWDRLSWFGLKDVSEDGTLTDHLPNWSHNVVVETLEAALIESLEPAQNRRRGDNFAAVEYLQFRDPDIDKHSKQRLLAELAKGIEG